MKIPQNEGVIPSSFRDPSGFLFYQDGFIFRQVNASYQSDYELLTSSGLYDSLVDAGLLISHKEVELPAPIPAIAFKILKPELVPFISYPYEWSFSQLKDAALTTLKIQQVALDFGMSLKDSSAYNIQFNKGKPVLIDSLSFEKYREGEPWVAYRQFCQHFLAPLALMSYTDIRLSQLLRIYLDGIPLDLASSLLPRRTNFRFSLLSHIHLHARSQKRYSDKPVEVSKRRMGRNSFLGLIDNLQNAIKKLTWQEQETDWAEYYDETNYSTKAFEHKRQLVDKFLEKSDPEIVWDLGANTGVFSRIASDKGALVMSFDVDPGAVEKNYLESVRRGDTKLLPLLLDLTNPSPDCGWGTQERNSIISRGPSDTALALALIHHLAISNNLPFDRIAAFLVQICQSLIIEFVPKEDSQVQRLLMSREDIFPNYTREAFEHEFAKYFTLQEVVKVDGSERTLFLMTAR